MKKIALFFLLPLFFHGLFSCTRDYPNLYNEYSGTIPSQIKPNSQGETLDKSSYPVTIRIEPSYLTVNNERYLYEIIDDNETSLILMATDAEQEETIRFRFLKSEEKLIMEDEKMGTEIELYTEEKWFENKLNDFASVPLTANIDHLSANQKDMLKILFDVAGIMDELFWMQSWGNKDELMATTESETLKKLFEINYGPWERLNNNAPLVDRFPPKNPGANFYPRDMTIAEFTNLDNPDKNSLYTLLRRNNEGQLYTQWYHEAYEKQVNKASELLLQASELSDDPGFKQYLKLRAKALLTDNYYESDVAWMKMKDNLIDFVVGPIENYEDQLLNYKAAHEAFILIKDQEWSNRIASLASLLPDLQKSLPVEPRFKTEIPGTESDLNVYEAVYYAGDCNAGSKTIAINLPNDPEVRAKYGSRKLQLKNSIRYKFEKILIPISNVLIAEDQRKYIDFNAFFENTMFHEVAHGLGLDYTINQKGSVREALKEAYSPIEEGKADILGLYIVTRLAEMGELGEKDLMTNYVTFMASIFRSVRFGASSAHGKANMMRFYFFSEKEAFSRDAESGQYRVNFEKMKNAMEDLTREIISIQGMGDYERAIKFINEKGFIREQLHSDLYRLNKLSIPVDLRFEQGPEILGL